MTAGQEEAFARKEANELICTERYLNHAGTNENDP
jgi:hypothetical protein